MAGEALSRQGKKCCTSDDIPNTAFDRGGRLVFWKASENRGELEKFLIPDYHPAIVSKELFLAANQSRQADF